MRRKVQAAQSGNRSLEDLVVCKISCKDSLYKRQIIGENCSSASQYKTRRRATLLNLFSLLLFSTMFSGTAAVATNRRWCGLDLSQQVSSADVIAKTSVVSRSVVGRDGSYLVTFRIDKLFHSRYSGFRSKFLRLHLESPNFNLKQKCSLATKVRPDTKYLLMLKQNTKLQGGLFAGEGVMSLVAPPLRGNKKNLRELRGILCPNCGSKKSSKDVKIRHSRHNREESSLAPRTKRMRLTCSARGNPPPTLYWTLNGVKIRGSSQAKIVTKKISKYLRKSVLKLNGSQDSSVHVQCHAYNSYGHTSRVKLKSMQPTRQISSIPSSPSPPSSPPPFIRRRSRSRSRSRLRSSKQKSLLPGLRSPMYSSGCPLENYCMNGGKCRYFSGLGELSCQCSAGFQGRRCERKYISGGDKLLGPKMSDKMPICLTGMGHHPC